MLKKVLTAAAFATILGGAAPAFSQTLTVQNNLSVAVNPTSYSANWTATPLSISSFASRNLSRSSGVIATVIYRDPTTGRGCEFWLVTDSSGTRVDAFKNSAGLNGPIQCTSSGTTGTISGF